MQAILLAAGFGTRLRPYTHVRPKPLFPVLNRKLIHIHLATLSAMGCRKIVVNTHHLSEQVEQAVAAWPGIHLQVEPEILGTGGSLRKALEVLDDAPVLVINGDIFHNIDLHLLYTHHCAGVCPVTMAVHDYPRFNTVTIKSGLVENFSALAGTSSRAFTGIHVVNPEVLECIAPGIFFHIIDLYAEMALAGRVASYSVDGAFWCDMGTPKDYLKLHAHLLQDGSKKNRWLVAPSAHLEPGVVLEGWGCIGAHSVVEGGSRLRNCVVWDEAHITGDQVLQDAIVPGSGNNSEGA